VRWPGSPGFARMLMGRAGRRGSVIQRPLRLTAREQFCVANSNAQTIRRVTSGGVVTTLAGLDLTSGAVDGAGANARFGYPSGIASTRTVTLYVADPTTTRAVEARIAWPLISMATARPTSPSNVRAVGPAWPLAPRLTS